MDCITGTIDNVFYHKTSEFSEAGCKFLIARFTYNDESGKKIQTTVKGEMNKPSYGINYNLYGQWKDEPKYGKAFAFDSFEPIVEKSHKGMADYLARAVPEIGEVRARLIVDHFGDDSFKILKTDPDRLSEVKGIPRVAL